jgi:NAD(P)-dependent dehydrogenase (short-subunit alcohol dehydrogenase family)
MANLIHSTVLVTGGSGGFGAGAAQRAIPTRDPLAVCFSTDGLTKLTDRVHYDPASQQELGFRFAEALRPLLARDPRSQRP